ncbi:MAG: DUF1318 domain-containing protein [Opitutaceae bacterium]|nr:DUF1318 domain-containing protein [Opitutaceae bacterium]
MKTSLFRLTLLLVALVLAPIVTRAEDLGAVRARMEQRLPQIDALKSSGALGENNRGFLEARSGDGGSVAAAENRDREVVYAELAKRTGASTDSVGRARAKQIAANSAPGVWLQRESGEWYQK